MTVDVLEFLGGTATVGHNDGSSKASDWLIPLRWAQKAGSDWPSAVLASFLRLAVAALQASQTDSEGSHVDAWFCVNRCTLDG